MRPDVTDVPCILTGEPPSFVLQRAEPERVPAGVEYAGLVRCPHCGGHIGVHARVVEREGRKQFEGGAFAVDLTESQTEAA